MLVPPHTDELALPLACRKCLTPYSLKLKLNFQLNVSLIHLREMMSTVSGPKHPAKTTKYINTSPQSTVLFISKRSIS